jgi:thiol-disulfide isomerase/thioredoxin
MSQPKPLFVASLLVVAGLVAPAGAAEAPAAPTLAIGTPAPDFDLPGVDGRRQTLGDFASARVLVLVFTCNHCPTAQAYEGRLQKLHDDYADQGVALVAISPNDPKAVRLDELGYSDLGDSLDDMKVRARDSGFTFPYLYDGETQETARRYGPVATPHVFVFDASRKLRFAGRVDDGENPARITVQDTRNAIEALLAGRPVPVETTKVFGCSIKWADKRSWVDEGAKRWAAEEVGLASTDSGSWPWRERIREAPPHQRLGHVVRPLRDRVPGPDRDPQDVPRARVRGRHRRRRSTGGARCRPQVPEGPAGLHPELLPRERRPLRHDRGPGSPVARAAAPHAARGPRRR